MAGWVRMPFPPLSLSPNAVAAANEAKMQLISGGGELRPVVMKSRYTQSTFIRRRRIIERQVSSFVVGHGRRDGPEEGVASVRRFIGGFLAART